MPSEEMLVFAFGCAWLVVCSHAIVYNDHGNHDYDYVSDYVYVFFNLN